MHKGIVISIHHEHAERILNGEKTLEIRKTVPQKVKLPYYIYMYETKGSGEGAVVGCFKCISHIEINDFNRGLHDRKSDEQKISIAKQACLRVEKLEDYASGDVIYGLTVSKPIHFSKSLPLSAFGLKFAPQSWQYLRN